MNTAYEMHEIATNVREANNLKKKKIAIEMLEAHASPAIRAAAEKGEFYADFKLPATTEFLVVQNQVLEVLQDLGYKLVRNKSLEYRIEW